MIKRPSNTSFLHFLERERCCYNAGIENNSDNAGIENNSDNKGHIGNNRKQARISVDWDQYVANSNIDHNDATEVAAEELCYDAEESMVLVLVEDSRGKDVVEVQKQP